MLAGGIYYATHRARASFGALLPAFLYQQFEHIVNYQYSGRDASSAKRRDFHFCRLYPGDDFATSLSRHEHYLCLKLKVKPGDTVLVVGCGTGDALFELVHYADVNVVGFDEDHEKVRLAEERLAARRAGLGNRTVRFVSGRIDDIAVYFDDESFDGVYSIEGFRNATSFHSIYQQIQAILKPGARAAIIDWCFTNSLTPAINIDHTRLSLVLQHAANLYPRSPHERSITSASSAIRMAGLYLEEFEDLAQRQGRIAWYEPLERALMDPRMIVGTTRAWTSWPQSTDFQNEEEQEWYDMFGVSREAAVVIVEAGRRKLFTPMAMFAMQKPQAQIVSSC
ncbi:S-adenosyl-L-methionine-dependent methyltransferase [Irpex lacteus]|nr:S-adenosyl-L-methionine-dependent methyltransferase [Irpex lacteus]